MKKTLLIITFVFVFSLSAIAEDGNTPVGTRNCPTVQPCLVAIDETPETKADETNDEDSFLLIIKRLITEIF